MGKTTGMWPRQKAQIGDLVVVIIGASSGIGRATAHQCARRGASLILAARTTESTLRWYCPGPSTHRCSSALRTTPVAVFREPWVRAGQK